MPPLKQPIPLRNMAMDVMVKFFTNYCNKCCTENSLDKLREGINVIKEDVASYIPCNISADFHEKLLQEILLWPKYWSVKRRKSRYEKILLEIIMDRKIIGLRCTDRVLASLDPSDADRISGLKELSLSYFWNRSAPYYSLDNFRLEDLTVLDFKPNCTDADLEVIGQNCRKLESLNAALSDKVTDWGLRSLRPCSELQVVYLYDCPRITLDGINELLLRHDKIHTIVAWNDESIAEGFDCFTHKNSSVYPTIKCFSVGFRLRQVGTGRLRTIVAKFPNLTSLTLVGNVTGDLRVLKDLGKLSHLDFFDVNNFSWENFDELLTFVGSNILDLQITCTRRFPFCMTQERLNFIFRYCPSIESLRFHYLPLHGEKLVVPNFQKLNAFMCHVPSGDDCIFELEFDKMPELKQFILHKSYVNVEAIESMILDHTKFPKLKQITVHDLRGGYDINRVKKLIKDKNLDLVITDLDPL